MRSRADLRAFVAALRIPDERREVVHAELEDHVFEEMAELESQGLDREAAERAAIASLGSAEALALRFREVESEFEISVPRARVLGFVRGIPVALVSFAVLLVEPNFPEPPSLRYYVVVGLAFLFCWPWHLSKTIHRGLVRDIRESLEFRLRSDAVRPRPGDAGGEIFAFFILAATLPFFLWIVACALELPLGAIEGPMLGTCFGGFLCTVAATIFARISPLFVRSAR